MNAVDSHPKVHAALRLTHQPALAGTVLEGSLDVRTSAQNGLGLAEIKCELVGIEELVSTSTTLREIVLHAENLYQGEDLPPSNICHPSAEARRGLPLGFWLAREGQCSFPLRFSLPKSLPSSVAIIRIASVRYELRSTISVFWKGKTSSLVTTSPVDIVEAIGALTSAGGDAVAYNSDGDDGTVSPWGHPSDGLWEGKLGGLPAGGKITLEIGVGERCLVAGTNARILLKVINHSRRKLSHATLSLSRRLRLPASAEDQDSEPGPALRFRDTVFSVPFRALEFQPGSETVVPLDFRIPADARSLHAGLRQDSRGRWRPGLFEICCFVEVKIGTGILGKDISVEMPVFVGHIASLPASFLSMPPRLHPTIALPLQIDPAHQFQRSMSPFPPSISPGTLSPDASPIGSYSPVQSPLRPASAARACPPQHFPRSQSVDPHSVHAQPYYHQPQHPAPEFVSFDPTSSILSPPSIWGVVPPGQTAASWAPPRPTSAVSRPSPGWGSPALTSSDAVSSWAPPPAVSGHDPRSGWGVHVHSGVAPAAERISAHLRDSSRARGRSVSPPRSIVPEAVVESWAGRTDGQAHGPSTGFVASSSLVDAPPGFVSYSKLPTPAVLSPRAVPLPTAPYDAAHKREQGVPGTTKDVADLEAMADDLSLGPHINKTLPRPPVPSARTKSTVHQAVKPSLVEAFERASIDKEARQAKRAAEKQTKLANLEQSLSIPKWEKPVVVQPKAETAIPSSTPVKTALPSSPTPSPLAAASKVPPLSGSARVDRSIVSRLEEVEQLNKIKAGRVDAWLETSLTDTEAPGASPSGFTIKCFSPDRSLSLLEQPSTPRTLKELTPLRQLACSTSPVSTPSSPVAPASAFTASKPRAVWPPKLEPAPSSPPALVASPQRSPKVVISESSKLPAIDDLVINANQDRPIVVPDQFAERLKKSWLGSEETAKHNIASARGGRGGRVSDVAKLWATAFEAPIAASAAPTTKAPRVSSGPVAPAISLPTSDASKISIATPRGAPPNLLKSSSAPAFLNTSSHAPKASLSSAASLVRSATGHLSPAALQSLDSAGQARERIGPKTIGTLDKSFSKAKLRELQAKFGN